MRESVRVCITGLNLDAAINKIVGAGIKIYNIDKRSMREIFFDVKYSKKEQLFALLDTLCYNIKILKVNSMTHNLKKLSKRVGILLGLFFSAILIFLSSFSVTTLKVYGNKGIEKEAILQTLEDNGIEFGLLKFNVNFEKAKKVLYTKFKTISYVETKRVGTALIITIQEENEAPVKKSVNGDIVSNYDSVISKIITYSGTPLVKEGDKVCKGDILIKGEIRSNDENASNVEKVEAEGVVVGEIADDVKIDISNSLEYLIDEKQQPIEKRELCFFGFNSLITKEENTFKRYIKVEKKEYIFENFLLPIYINKTTYIPVTNKVNMDKKYEYELLVENMYLDKYFGSTKYILKESTKQFIQENNQYFLRYKYKIHLNIGTFLQEEI